METSKFYRARLERRFPVTPLLLEHISLLLSEFEDAEEAQLNSPAIIKDSLRKLEIVEGKPSDEDVSYTIQRINTMMAETQAKTGEGAQIPKKATFASSYAKWLSELDLDGLCLLIAGFDLRKATALYTETDKEDLIWLANRYTVAKWEEIKINYESVVYGFGGSYKGDSSTSNDGGSYDLTKDNKSGMAALGKML